MKFSEHFKTVSVDAVCVKRSTALMFIMSTFRQRTSFKPIAPVINFIITHSPLSITTVRVLRRHHFTYNFAKRLPNQDFFKNSFPDSVAHDP